MSSSLEDNINGLLHIEWGNIVVGPVCDGGVKEGDKFGLGVALQGGGGQLHRGGLGGGGVGQVEDVQIFHVPHQLLLVLRDFCKEHRQGPAQQYLYTDGGGGPSGQTRLELYLRERFVQI